MPKKYPTRYPALRPQVIWDSSSKQIWWNVALNHLLTNGSSDPLLVDYCDVFISCLDSHSDGTHSLQRIHCWASDVKLNFSNSVLMKKQTHLHLRGPANFHFWVNHSFESLTNKFLVYVLFAVSKLYYIPHCSPDICFCICPHWSTTNTHNIVQNWLFLHTFRLSAAPGW